MLSMDIDNYGKVKNSQIIFSVEVYLIYFENSKFICEVLFIICCYGTFEGSRKYS